MSQLHSISKLTIINIGNAVVGVAMSVAMAWLFGTTDRIGSYFVAATLLSVVQKVFFVGQFSEVFLPEYVQRREVAGGAKADRCFSALYNHLILILLVTALGAAFVLPWISGIIAPGFDADQRRQMTQLSQALLGVMILVVANGHLQIIGNARGWYGRFESYGLYGSALGLIAFIATGKMFGVWSLVLSQGVTQIVLFAGSWIYLYRQGYRHAWIWNEPDFSVWAVVGRVGYTALSIGAAQFYVLSFNAALTLLPAVVLPVYKYAETLYSRVGILFMRPVAVVFFTDAALLAHRNPAQLRARISEALYHYALMYFLVLVAVFPALNNLLGAIWGGRHYHAAEIQQTTFFVFCFLGLLIFDGAGLLYRRLNVIMGDLRRHYTVMTIVQLAMACAAPFLVQALGVAGAAWVLILNIVAQMLAGLAIVYFCRPQFLAFFPTRTWKLALAAVLPVLLAWLFPVLLPALDYAGDFSPWGKIRELTKAGILGGTGFLLGVGVAWVLGVDEARVGWGRLRGQLQSWRLLRAPAERLNN